MAAIVFWGIVNGLAATLGYSFASAFLRQAAHDPPIWVSTIKAACTAMIFVPWLIALAAKREKILPPWRVIWMLVAVSLFVQICGNVFYQVALAQIGIALAVPVTLGAMVFSGAVLGRVLMNEPLSPKIALGLGILIAAISLLSVGAKHASGVITSGQSSPLAWLWGALAAIFSGFAYAVLGLGVRQSTQHQIPLATPIVFVSVIGTVALGLLSLLLEGVPRIQAISQVSWMAMIAAGLLNGVAFLALAKALKILPVVYVNAINTLQMVASAFLGLLWFSEPWTHWHLVGLVLSIAGLSFLAYAAHDHRKRMRASAIKTLG
jgi:drug/metabolite transporter (DMT)-like permease